MKIVLQNIGKRYNQEWIFRNVNYELTSDNAYVILGSNGSGKSTLLQVIAGNILSSEGGIEYATALKKQAVLPETIFNYLSFASPYIELLEEYTLFESIRFHSQFKNFFPSLTAEAIVDLSGLEKSKNKALKYYSSGMRQRVRLALAILSNTPLLLLDEPTSNLDKKGIEWYQNLIADFSKGRLVIVCSNHHHHEYEFCNKELLMENYK